MRPTEPGRRSGGGSDKAAPTPGSFCATPNESLWLGKDGADQAPCLPQPAVPVLREDLPGQNRPAGPHAEEAASQGQPEEQGV